jgi:Beta-lactamase
MGKHKGKPNYLSERMQFYRVPGVSVAFFDPGKIIWTRAYGLADTATKKSVTSETLFQAASISKPVSISAFQGINSLSLPRQHAQDNEDRDYRNVKDYVQCIRADAIPFA